MRRQGQLAAAIVAAALAAGAAQPPREPVVRYVRFDEVRELLSHPSLPPAIRSGSVPDRTRAFDAWVRTRDRDIRQRVQRGEEDALVPLLLFGTSYTAEPRLTRDFFEGLRRQFGARPDAAAEMEREFGAVFERRTDALLAGLAAPGDNPRLIWARAAVQRAGHTFDTPAGRAAAGRFLIDTFARVTRESGALAAGLAAGNQPLERAHAFASRALAPDSSWPINFALREALSTLRAAGTLSSLRRVAIVGPGLDIIDKDEGFDIHPPQSLQPFAVIDAVVGLGLAAVADLGVLTIDVNQGVNAHLRAARASKRPYVVQLLAANRPWTDAALSYWSAFGDASGAAAAPAASPAGIRIRAVAFPAGVTQRLSVVDANIVGQRLAFPESPGADLAVATNVLLYYDAAEQPLAAANMAALLRPGGVLLTNTELIRLPETLTPVGRTLTVFSTRPNDGEIVYAYLRQP